MNHLKNIHDIIHFSPRQGNGERKTEAWVKQQLTIRDIPFVLQKFHIDIPDWTNWELKLDGTPVDCLPSGLRSGRISDKTQIRNSLLEEEFATAPANINFNPVCPAISRPSLYAQPALSVSPAVLVKILRAKKIEGFMKVRRNKHTAANILVGNQKNPHSILFAHMDSVETGAIDNASGVSVTLGVIAKRPDLLKKHLFVFSAGEEMSFDMPTYWGYDFRVFEERLPHLFKKAKAIIAVDCVGFAKTLCQSGADSEEVYLAFPIRNYAQFKHKIYLFGGEYKKLLPVYHSVIDDGRMLKEVCLQQAEKMLLRRLA